MNFLCFLNVNFGLFFIEHKELSSARGRKQRLVGRVACIDLVAKHIFQFAIQIDIKLCHAELYLSIRNVILQRRKNLIVIGFKVSPFFLI